MSHNTNPKNYSANPANENPKDGQGQFEQYEFLESISNTSKLNTENNERVISGNQQEVDELTSKYLNSVKGGSSSTTTSSFADAKSFVDTNIVNADSSNESHTHNYLRSLVQKYSQNTHKNETPLYDMVEEVHEANFFDDKNEVNINEVSLDEIETTHVAINEEDNPFSKSNHVNNYAEHSVDVIKQPKTTLFNNSNPSPVGNSYEDIYFPSITIEHQNEDGESQNTDKHEDKKAIEKDTEEYENEAPSHETITNNKNDIVNVEVETDDVDIRSLKHDDVAGSVDVNVNISDDNISYDNNISDSNDNATLDRIVEDEGSNGDDDNSDYSTDYEITANLIETLAKVRIAIVGMSCQSCSTRIEKVLQKHEAVRHATVNFASEIASVTFDGNKIDIRALIALVKKEGFSASEYDPRHRAKKRRAKKKQAISTNTIATSQTESNATIDSKNNSSKSSTIKNDVKNVADYFSGTSFGAKKLQKTVSDDASHHMTQGIASADYFSGTSFGVKKIKNSISDDFSHSVIHNVENLENITNIETNDLDRKREPQTYKNTQSQAQFANTETHTVGYQSESTSQSKLKNDGILPEDNFTDNVTGNATDSATNNDENIAEEKVNRLANRFANKSKLTMSELQQLAKSDNDGLVSDLTLNSANQPNATKDKYKSKPNNFEIDSLKVDTLNFDIFNVDDIESDDSQLTDMQSEDEDIIYPRHTPWRVVLLCVCALPFIVAMMGMFVGKGMAWTLPVGFQFIIASFTQFVLAFPFYKNAWRSLKARMANMDVLVVLGSLSTWLYSTTIWWLESVKAGVSGIENMMVMHSPQVMDNLYFEAGVMIITFISLGKFLEARTKKYSLNSINMLMSLTPEIVERQSDIGDFYEVDIEDVQVNDVIKAKQGDRVACDGIVVEGDAWCDESHLTGESRLVSKAKGEPVIAGAIIENGSVLYCVTDTASDSQLADMIEALNDAQGSKAPIARLADNVAAYFVPAVMLIAIITFGVSFWVVSLSFGMALMHAVAVLVIACPCALGLATPAAIMAGMGVAAKHGVWFKDAESLEQAGKIDTVVMDKTGTLTEGSPTLVAHLLMNRTLQLTEVLQLAASVEDHVNHPLATALVNSAKQRDINILKAKNVHVSSGNGVQGDIEGVGLVKVGSLDWVKFPFPDNMAEKMHGVWQLASIVAVSINDVPLGAFALADDIRSDAKQTVFSLRNKGINVILMSGDKDSVVTHVADKLGIEKAFSNMTPRDKAGKILEIQKSGYKVAMVGDGVNDALAMATADASFAMNEGTDVARHSASARLMGSSLMQLYDARQIASATVKNIKQNLFFALVYNCICIPMAAIGWISPTLAGLAMACSSITVLMNSLRLKRYSPRKSEWE